MSESIADSPLGLHVGRGKYLYAVAVEMGISRIPDVLYFSAESVEEVRVSLVRGARTLLPRGSRVVGIAPAVGIYHDERGDVLEAG